MKPTRKNSTILRSPPKPIVLKRSQVRMFAPFQTKQEHSPIVVTTQLMKRLSKISPESISRQRSQQQHHHRSTWHEPGGAGVPGRMESASNAAQIANPLSCCADRNIGVRILIACICGRHLGNPSITPMICLKTAKTKTKKLTVKMTLCMRMRRPNPNQKKLTVILTFCLEIRRTCHPHLRDLCIHT